MTRTRLRNQKWFDMVCMKCNLLREQGLNISVDIREIPRRDCKKTPDGHVKSKIFCVTCQKETDHVQVGSV